MFKNDVINCVREHLDKWYATGHHQETAIQLVDEYEERIRADAKAKTIEEVYERFNSDLGSFGFWLYEQIEEQKNERM